MKQPAYIVVFITASGPEESEKISRSLLERRLAVCVNIVPGVKSAFWWQDRLEDTEEELLIVKSRENLLAELVDNVRKLSSNEVPEVIAMPVIGGNPDYLAWLDHETA